LHHVGIEFGGERIIGEEARVVGHAGHTLVQHIPHATNESKQDDRQKFEKKKKITNKQTNKQTNKTKATFQVTN
jgi:hypothetical protein